MYTGADIKPTCLYPAPDLVSPAFSSQLCFGEGFDTICCCQMVPLITPDLLMIKTPSRGNYSSRQLSL